jgi:hypothetical protein
MAIKKKSGRMAAYHRRIERQVEQIFEQCPDADEPHAFILAYESRFRRFPFPYAVAHTEFGQRFGRDLSQEDAGWGKFRPADDPMSLEEHLEEVEAAQPLIDKYQQERDEQKEKQCNRTNEFSKNKGHKGRQIMAIPKPYPMFDFTPCPKCAAEIEANPRRKTPNLCGTCRQKLNEAMGIGKPAKAGN